MKKILLMLCLAASTALAGTPVEDLIMLARSGVDSEVLQAYVETSNEPFDLTAEDIIALRDLGVPAQVINAALHRGQELGPPAAQPAPAQPEVQVAPAQMNLNISFFYDALSPYGRWLLIEGDWCWQPIAARVGIEWAPYYTRGHWVYTDWGWYWISDYSWGWIPFHYGRWFRHPVYGWCWWPDHEWAPAWVAWRYGGGYWGWAPMPRYIHYVHNRGFHHGRKRLRHGHDFGLKFEDYFFLALEHLADPKPWVHIIPPKRAAEIYKKTVFDPDGFGERNGRFHNRGPNAESVAAASGKKIAPLSIISRDLKAGQPITGGRKLPNGLEVYAPKIAPEKPRPPTAQPAEREGLSGKILERRQEATRLTLEKKKAEAEAAQRERQVLADSAKREGNRLKKDELKAEIEVRDQRAQQAKAKVERINRWQPAPAAPLPKSRKPGLKEETKDQVQSEAKEEQDKQKALEDLLRKKGQKKAVPEDEK